MFVAPNYSSVPPVLHEGRIPVVEFVQGDTFEIETTLLLPDGTTAASSENSELRMVMANRRIHDEILWEGDWDDAEQVNPDTGLVKINLPKTLTDELERGSYLLSVQLSTYPEVPEGGEQPDPPVPDWVRTVLDCYVFVEYSATSPLIDVPYLGE